MKLWHKYAIALFLVAVLPLTVAAWQIAGRGAEEVTASTRAYLASVGDTGLGEVRSLIERGVSEAKAIGATVAMVAVPAEERMRTAESQLIGASVLQNFVVYTPSGDSVQEMQGANAEAHAVAGAITPPAPLPEALRKLADDKDAAFAPVVRRADGALFLPMTTRIRKPTGELYAYGWTAIPLTGLSVAMSDLGLRRFSDKDLVTLIDAEGEGKGSARLRVLAAGDPARLGTPYVPGGQDIGVDDPKDFDHDMTHTFEYQAASGEARFGAVTPVVDARWGGLHWGIAAEQPKDEVFAPVARIWQTALLIGVGFAVLALLLGVWAGRRLSAPVVALSKAARRVAGGDFDVKVAVPGNDEVGQLATSFNAMAGQLTTTIAELQQTTAAKQRMQTELDIGRNIQMSMVPLKFPAFPERREFDVHAALEPAFEVGGDFYDFFLIDEHTFCVCIADVSGKGVPAALFMAVTRTLVKAHAEAGAASEEILEKVNDDLALDNDACMFVTLFLGLVDLRTGVMAYTNAGHNPSYIKRTNGTIERLDALHGPVIAAVEDVPYGAGKATLGKGDALVMYTDGVNEAMNAKEELYTEERLAKLIQASTWSSSKDAVKTILDDVWRFQGAADQADDITIVVLRYLGSVGESSLRR